MVQVVIVISIVVILGAMTIWSLAAPFIEPITTIASGVNSWILQVQGRCPDVKAEVTASYPGTDWFFVTRCYHFIQVQVDNQGKLETPRVKIDCDIKTNDGMIAASKYKIINSLGSQEREAVNMNIYHDCGLVIESYDCRLSFENPCE